MKPAMTATRAHRPESEDHLHLAEEVQHFGLDTRRARATIHVSVMIGTVLNVVGVAGEAGGRKRVNDRQRENAGRPEIERVGVYPCGERRPQTVGRRRTVVGKRNRERRRDVVLHREHDIVRAGAGQAT